MNKKTPDWFRLLSAWRDKNRLGLTLPFLVGARAHLTGSSYTTRAHAEAIMAEIKENPIQNHVVEATWCPHLQAPVLRISPRATRITHRTTEIKSVATGKVAIVFDVDLVNKWGCDPESLLKALLDDATEPILSGQYSRTWTDSGRTYGPFDAGDITFMQAALGT